MKRLEKSRNRQAALPVRHLQAKSRHEGFVGEHHVSLHVPHPGADDGARIHGKRGAPGRIAKARFTFGKCQATVYAFGGFVHEAQHAADVAVGLAHRRKRNVEEHFFEMAMAIDMERSVDGRKALALLQHLVQQRAKVVPQLRPVFCRRPSEGCRVLQADGRRVGVVVQRDQVGPPEKHHLRMRRQHQFERRAQGLRPSRWGPQRRATGIEPTRQRCRLAGASRPSEQGRFALHQNIMGGAQVLCCPEKSQ